MKQTHSLTMVRSANTSIGANFLIRQVRGTDADELLRLIKKSSGGLSSLQPRLDFLRQYIAESEASFAGHKDIDDPHKYLLVMEDISKGRVMGCAAVKTRIGVSSPFINFDICGDGLDQYLSASSRFTGATEVGSLFLDPDYRAMGLGRYLAKVRYLLIASEPWRFGETVIAELRGQCGTEGSPLYDYLFADKLEKTFLQADAEYFDRNPEALGDIVPIGKISTWDFPDSVKAAIGHSHPSGRGAMRMLQNEGFIFSGTIDLFDAGPIMTVYRDTIRTVMQSRACSLALRADSDNFEAAYYTSLVAAGDVANFRALVTPGRIQDDHLHLPSQDRAQVQALLRCSPGSDIRVWQDETQSIILDPAMPAKAYA